jgi:hypothetical protein
MRGGVCQRSLEGAKSAYPFYCPPNAHQSHIILSLESEITGNGILSLESEINLNFLSVLYTPHQPRQNLVYDKFCFTSTFVLPEESRIEDSATRTVFVLK